MRFIGKPISTAGAGIFDTVGEEQFTGRNAKFPFRPIDLIFDAIGDIFQTIFREADQADVFQVEI